MARVVFTPHLKKHVECPDREVSGSTVREVFEEIFRGSPALRGYLVDERGRMRGHVTVFVDGERIVDRDGLGDRVGTASEVYVMQALSGG